MAARSFTTGENKCLKIRTFRAGALPSFQRGPDGRGALGLQAPSSGAAGRAPSHTCAGRCLASGGLGWGGGSPGASFGLWSEAEKAQEGSVIGHCSHQPGLDIRPLFALQDWASYPGCGQLRKPSATAGTSAQCSCALLILFRGLWRICPDPGWFPEFTRVSREPRSAK